MPIQGQLKGKIPKQQITLQQNSDITAGVSTQQLQEIKQDEIPELIRKNSAILENLNLMYETIHNETQLLKTLKQETSTKDEPPIFEKKQEVTTKKEPKKKPNKSPLPGVSKSMIPLLKKKPQQPAPALLPRWR